MTIEQKILLKLEPHAKRIKDDKADEFDYLPAVLFQLLEEQNSIKSTVTSAVGESKTQIATFEEATQRQMELLNVSIKDIQTHIQNAREQISSVHAEYAKKINEDLVAMGSKIESVLDNVQRSQAKSMRILIAGLVASTMLIGLTVVILLRH